MKVTLIFFLLIGCASKRTPYQSYKKKEGGYREDKIDGLRVVNFTANSRTKKEMAILFAKFRALELCREDESKHLHVLGLQDKTEREKVSRTHSNFWGPSYYYGMSPYYHHYYQSSLSVGFNTASSSSYEETYIYPAFDVIYDCDQKIYGPELILREVPASEMRILVKDLKGGLQVEKILEGSPNNKLLEYGDVILKANNVRIEKIYQLLRLFDKDKTVKVQIMREGVKKDLRLKASDVTKDVVKSEQETIRSACKEEDISKRPLCN